VGETVGVGVAGDVTEQLHPTRRLVLADALVVVGVGLAGDLGEKTDDHQRFLGNALLLELQAPQLPEQATRAGQTLVVVLDRSARWP
jgi:hypothetical protein